MAPSRGSEMPVMCCICSETPSSVCAAIRAHRSQINRLQKTREALAHKAAQQTAEDAVARARSETHARFSRAVRDLEQRLSQERAATDKARDGIQAAKERIQQRRARLEAARLQLASLQGGLLESHRQRNAVLQRQWDELASQVAHARQILVSEAIASFSPEAKHVAVPSKTFKSRFVLPKTKLQYRIAGSALPAFSEMKAACGPRSLPATQSALLSLTRCIALIASYLGLSLPFVASLGTSPAVCGSPASSWAQKFATRQSLEYDPTRKMDQAADSTGSFTSFVTAYAMLVYNLAFICHNQGLAYDLSQPNQVIPSLLALADLPKQIRPSDSLAYRVSSVGVLALDFKQFLDGCLAAATNPKAGLAEKVEFGEEPDGWGLVKFGSEVV